MIFLLEKVIYGIKVHDHEKLKRKYSYHKEHKPETLQKKLEILKKINDHIKEYTTVKEL